MQIEPGVDQAFSASANAALYRTVLDCVRLAEREGNGLPVTLRIEHRAHVASVRVTAPGLEPSSAQTALAQASDRVTALNGELVARYEGNDLVVEASVPCES